SGSSEQGTSSPPRTLRAIGLLPPFAGIAVVVEGARGFVEPERYGALVDDLVTVGDLTCKVRRPADHIRRGWGGDQVEQARQHHRGEVVRLLQVERESGEHEEHA